MSRVPRTFNDKYIRHSLTYGASPSIVARRLGIGIRRPKAMQNKMRGKGRRCVIIGHRHMQQEASVSTNAIEDGYDWLHFDLR